MSEELREARNLLERVHIQLVAAEADGYGSRELSVAKTKTDEAGMWLERLMNMLAAKKS